MSEKLKEMIDGFICPGCVCGSSITDCERAKKGVKIVSGSGCCMEHVVGTDIFGIGRFALGLPKGFCRAGDNSSKLEIRCYEEYPPNYYNVFNIPVWFMERDGYTFVRVVAPRIARVITHVINGAWGDKLREDWPGIQNVDETEMD